MNLYMIPQSNQIVPSIPPTKVSFHFNTYKSMKTRLTATLSSLLKEKLKLATFEHLDGDGGGPVHVENVCCFTLDHHAKRAAAQ